MIVLQIVLLEEFPIIDRFQHKIWIRFMTYPTKIASKIGSIRNVLRGAGNGATHTKKMQQMLMM